MEKGVEHGSIAPRRKWTKPFLAEGFWPSLPHLSRILQKKLFIALLQLDQWESPCEIYSLSDNILKYILQKDMEIMNYMLHFLAQDKILLWKCQSSEISSVNQIFKMKLAFYYIRKFLLQIDKNMISFWENINNEKDETLLQVNQKTNNFPLLNKYFKMKTTCWNIVKNPSVEG